MIGRHRRERCAAGEVESIDPPARTGGRHGLWDLGFLQLTPQNFALTPAGRLAAHGIAGAFLLLVGVGLVLANGNTKGKPSTLETAMQCRMPKKM
jgi:hypothetical protein